MATLSLQDKLELQELDKEFGELNSIVIQKNESGIIFYSQTFHEEFVQDDERYEYEGKFDDTRAGFRLQMLDGKRYSRYIQLKSQESEK